jgi:hypothetical protein
MSKIDIKPTWVGVSVTVVAMLLTFALSFGISKNQIDNNTKGIKRNTERIDKYEKNQLKMIEDLGEIKGYIKGHVENDS